MKVDIPLKLLIQHTYRCWKREQKAFDKFTNHQELEDFIDNGQYGVMQAFKFGEYTQGGVSSENNKMDYEFLLKNLLQLHDTWNNIDTEVEQIKQEFEKGEK